jgi:hypothetical protein
MAADRTTFFKKRHTQLEEWLRKQMKRAQAIDAFARKFASAVHSVRNGVILECLQYANGIRKKGNIVEEAVWEKLEKSMSRRDKQAEKEGRYMIHYMNGVLKIMEDFITREVSN